MAQRLKHLLQCRRPGFDPWVGKIPWRRNWQLQYSCLENPIDGEAWWATVHGVAKSRTQLSDFTFTYFLRTSPNPENQTIIFRGSYCALTVKPLLWSHPLSRCQSITGQQLCVRPSDITLINFTTPCEIHNYSLGRIALSDVCNIHQSGEFGRWRH